MKPGFLFVLLSAAALVSEAAPLDFTSIGTLACGAAANCVVNGGALEFTNNGAKLSISYIANSESGLNVPLQPGFATTNFGNTRRELQYLRRAQCIF